MDRGRGRGIEEYLARLDRADQAEAEAEGDAARAAVSLVMAF
jgi:hypothetical protein